MSLRAMHVFFILASIVLTVFVCGWAVREGAWVLAAAALAGCLVLVIYLVYFLKTRRT